MHTGKKGLAFLFEAILVSLSLRTSTFLPVAAARSVDTRGDVGVHEERKIRPEPTAEYIVQLQYRPGSQLPTTSLVSLGRIGEPIAEDPLAGFKCWQNNLCDLLRPRSEHQCHLSMRIKPGRAGIEEYSSNALANFRSARLACRQYREAVVPQRFRELL